MLVLVFVILGPQAAIGLGWAVGPHWLATHAFENLASGLAPVGRHTGSHTGSRGKRARFSPFAFR